jgi:hypothetical protein
VFSRLLCALDVLLLRWNCWSCDWFFTLLHVCLPNVCLFPVAAWQVVMHWSGVTMSTPSYLTRQAPSHWAGHRSWRQQCSASTTHCNRCEDQQAALAERGRKLICSSVPFACKMTVRLSRPGQPAAALHCRRCTPCFMPERIAAMHLVHMCCRYWWTFLPRGSFLRSILNMLAALCLYTCLCRPGV